MLAYIRQEVMPPMTVAELDEGLARANRQFLSYGITSIQDATYRNDMARWQTIRGYIESGRLRSRVSMMAGPETRLQFQEAGMTTGAGDERLRLGAVKFLLDIQSEQAELNAAALECHKAGWQLAFHAVAESTVEAAVRALEYVASRSPVAGRRHRIEHCGECPPRLLERLRRLGAVIVTQPPFIYYSGERYLATVAPGQLPWLYRIKSPLESGRGRGGQLGRPGHAARPAGRRLRGGHPAGGVRPVPAAGEAVSPAQALTLYTTNAAFASFEEDVKGTITPGRLADLVVLSDDPTRRAAGADKRYQGDDDDGRRGGGVGEPLMSLRKDFFHLI